MGDRLRRAARLQGTGRKEGLHTALSRRIVDDAGTGFAIGCGFIALFCLAGAAAALATGYRFPARRACLARRLLVGLTWFGAGLLIARSVLIHVQFTLVLTGITHLPADQHAGFLHLARWFMLFWGPWFALGAIAWTRLAVAYTTRQRRSDAKLALERWQRGY